MPAKKPLVKKTSKKKTAPPKNRPSTKQISAARSAAVPTTFWGRLRQRNRAFLARKDHRSFRRTRRRDYIKQFQLPGYFGFTSYVCKTLWQRRTTYVLAVLFYTVLAAILVGMASQDALQQTIATLSGGQGSEVFSGLWGEISKAGLLLAIGAGGNFTSQVTESQQIYGVLLLLLVWLTTVWLLRAQLVGKTPRLRDALYSAGAPIVSTIVVFFLLMIQLLPGALGLVGYAAASLTGFLDNGLVAMLFAIVAALLVVLSLYLMTSTFFALVVVTLPGMYPWRALRTASDLVLGRRFRIILRFAWMMLVVVFFWAIIMIPLILLTNWLQTMWDIMVIIPVVPAALTIMSGLTIVFVSAYIYLLYRKLVDNVE